MLDLVLNAIGWFGTLCVLGSYLMLTHGRWAGTSVRYLVVNLMGAAGVGAITLYTQAWPTFALQVAWVLITLPALARALWRTNAKHSRSR